MRLRPALCGLRSCARIWFQFYSSAIKTTGNDSTNNSIYMFQFYSSAIKTSFSGVNKPEGEKFQFYSSAIKTLKILRFEKSFEFCFNSIVVRLRLTIYKVSSHLIFGFNSIVVRLRLTLNTQDMSKLEVSIL